MKIKFVTDSVADIPPTIAKQWDIGIVPCYVNYSGKSYKDDGIDLIREDYYNQLENLPDHPTTSAMSPELARESIDKAFAEADHLILITTPAKLSGIYNAFRQGSAHLPQDRVTLIDSGQLSIGMGWQVIGGAEVADATGDLQKTLSAIEKMRNAQQIHATIGSLEFLRRSGRIGWATANIGTLLNIKPVIELKDGEVSPIARVRTFKRSLDKLAEIAQANAPYERVAIVHINNPEGAEMLRTMITDILPDEIMTGLIGPALGTHIGPGSVGLATVSKGWKEDALRD
jgi:DegV family protein with EDD domain